MSEAELIERLTQAAIGSCSCGAMSPEPQYHAKRCWFGMLRLTIDALTASLTREGEMRRALEPFAKEYNAWVDGETGERLPETREDTIPLNGHAHCDHADFRRAAELYALSSPAPSSGEEKIHGSYVA